MFSGNFWGGDAYAGALFEQVRGTMLVTVFVFLGIEGASVYSRYAQEREDVGMATIFGFRRRHRAHGPRSRSLPYARAAARRDRRHAPALDGGVLEAVVGQWGAVFVSLGLLVSVLGAYLAWSLIGRRGPVRGRQGRDMPKLSRPREREQGARRRRCGHQHRRPALRHHDLLVARRLRPDARPHQRHGADPVPARGGLRLKLADRGETYEARPGERRRDLIIARIATIYTAFLLYRRRPEVHPALGRASMRPGSLLFVMGAARAGQAGLRRPVETG